MGNAPAKLFGVALVSSLPQFNLYQDSRFQVQAIFELDIWGLRKRQTGKVSCSVAIGRTQACSELASSGRQQPARRVTVAPLRFGLPFRVYANFSVGGLNSILVLSRGLRLRAKILVN